MHRTGSFRIQIWELLLEKLKIDIWFSGQLVSHHYLDNLAREVNERLQQRGTIAVPSLTKEYDLPTEFLLEQVYTHAQYAGLLCSLIL